MPVQPAFAAGHGEDTELAATGGFGPATEGKTSINLFAQQSHNCQMQRIVDIEEMPPSWRLAIDPWGGQHYGNGEQGRLCCNKEVCVNESEQCRSLRRPGNKTGLRRTHLVRRGGQGAFLIM